AHDFNNVLTAIQGFSEMLAMSLDGDEDRLELVDQVRQGAHRGTALIQQLLAFGQRQVPQVEVFDAGTAVVEMLPMLRRLLEANIKVDVTASCSAPIRADRQQLQQVLLNLFVNARDAMRRSGGTITASIDRVDGGEHGTMALTVQDDGEGMDEPTLARAFEPFFTTKADGAGTGLGLSTVRDIVTEAGGSITAESAPGKGTTMRVLWPLTDEPPAPEPEPEPDSLHAQPGQRVLVVDDEDSNRELATRVLSRFGYEVVSAPDGEAALEIAASDDQIDVVVTDVVMPGIGGRLLAEEIVALRPDMRIVFTSGFTSDDVLRTRVRADLVKFLPKPYTADDLAAIVARALAD
ncbi:MAG: response regulator, partial [Planctomycetes bacterium]|nr:response regulator [Planctomycetota bacterium]